MERYIEDFKSKYPYIQIMCDYKIRSCTYFGVIENNSLEELERFNLSIEKNG
jgi:hypothetical protein